MGSPVLGVAAVGLALGLAAGSGASAESIPYTLDAASDYQEGCQEGCACPVILTDLAGRFALRAAGRDADFDLFRVEDVHWTVYGGSVAVEGAGTYRLSRSTPRVQRLEAELRIDGEPAIAFDSGLVPASAPFPKIDIAVAMNGFYCFDRVFGIRASPEEPIPTSPAGWGRVKALYR